MIINYKKKNIKYLLNFLMTMMDGDRIKIKVFKKINKKFKKIIKKKINKK